MNTKSRQWFLVFCTLPALIIFSIFALYPFFQAIVMAFYDWSGMSDEVTFIGLKNFETLIHDPKVWTALTNNVFLLLVVPTITMGFSLLFAVLLTRRKLRETTFYRTIFFFPNVLAIVVISILWSFIYHPTFGILNSFLEAAGLNSWIHAWLGEKSTVLWALIFPMVWQAIGYYMIIYIAAIQGIPNDVYEAAVIDGASEWKQFTHMTVPLIWGILRITIIFFFIQVFNQSFVYIQVMTDGGPDGSSEILMTYMYKQAFQNGNFGYAMAVGVFMLFISLTLSFISDRLMGRDAVEY